MSAELIELAKAPALRAGRGILADSVGTSPSYALVTQPGPLAQLSEEVRSGAATTVMASSLDENHLERLAEGVEAVGRIVGVGGGVTMDTAKFIAWRRGLPLTLAPSIVSVDASVTNTIAVRRNGTVEYDGFVVAELIIADLELISSAPPRLNRAGVGDLLSIHTGRFDWALGARAGKIAFVERVDGAAAAVLERLYGLADEVAVVSDAALEHIIRAYIEVNALLLDVGHSGPEEGSEHYFAYAAEATTGREFVHGEIVGLGTVLMAGLQDNDPARAAAFLDRCRVGWRPSNLGLDEVDLERVLVSLPEHVRRADLAHSIIDETTLDKSVARDLVASIPPPERQTA